MKKETNSAALTAAPDKIENPEEASLCFLRRKRCILSANKAAI